MKLKLYTGAILATAALLAAAVIAIVDNLGREEETITSNFPQKVNHRVMLNPQDAEIESHIEYFRDDGTKVIAEIVYKNGISRYIHYRPSLQTVSRIMDYAKDEATGKLRVVAESYLTEDGQRLFRHAIYYDNGVIKRKGERHADGRYETIYYGEDGKTVLAQRVFEEDQTLFAEKGFYTDGSPKFVTEWESNYLVTKNFRRDGTDTSVVENHHGFHRGLYFREDGKTARIGFFRSSEFTEIIYFDSSGEPEYRVRYYEEELEVTAMAGDKKLYEQTWSPYSVKAMNHCNVSSNRLTKVREFKEIRSYPYRTVVARMFVFSIGMAHPNHIVVPVSPVANTIYNLDSDGIVTSIEYQHGGLSEEDRRRLPSDLYKVGDKVDYDSERMRLKKFECVEFPEKLDVPQVRTYRR